MIKTIIKRLDGSIGWISFNNSLEESNDWINQCLQVKAWGLPDRWVSLEDNSDLIVLAEDTRVLEVDGIEQTQYFFSSEYSIEQVDIGNTLQMELLRTQRNLKLASCDWTQLVDAPLDSDKKSEWASYRQALRDFPEQEGLDPLNPNWPDQPA